MYYKTEYGLFYSDDATLIDYIKDDELIGSYPADVYQFVLENEKKKVIISLKQYIRDELSKGYICFNQIKMDCTEPSISKFKSGIEISDLNNEATIDVVDYNNDIHQDVALSDADQMLLELANYNRGFYYHKQTKRQEIKAATTQPQLESVVWEMGI